MLFELALVHQRRALTHLRALQLSVELRWQREGALRLKPWAWTLGVGLEIVNILLSVYNITQGAVTGAIICSIIAGIILYYLFRPEVWKAFGR